MSRGQGTGRVGKRAERLSAAMRRERGYLYPEWEWVARQAPDFPSACDDLVPPRARLRRAAPGEGLGAPEAALVPGGAATSLNGLRALARLDAEPRKGS